MIMSKERKKLFAGRWGKVRLQELELHREKTEYEERYWTYDDPSYKFTDYALGERFDNEYDDIEDLYYEG